MINLEINKFSIKNDLCNSEPAQLLREISKHKYYTKLALRVVLYFNYFFLSWKSNFHNKLTIY